MSARAILAVSRTVADLARTEAFYRDGLGFSSEGPPEPLPAPLARAMGLDGRRTARLRMRLGAQQLAFLAVDPPGAPYPTVPRATDPFFQHVAIPVRDMAAAAARLAAAGAVPVSTGGPQRLPASSGGVTAWKVRDPDGHPVELIHFPGGPAAERWANPPGLFLGIDHSALTVTDLGTALPFYTGLLGFRLAPRAQNVGAEQARLDGLTAPEVDVLALVPAGTPTPHLELLHYRRPGSDRSTPARYGPADRATSRLVLAVTDLTSLANAIRAAGHTVRVAEDAAYAVGPDGHGLLLLRIP